MSGYRQPTFVFIGVTTGSSSMMRIFPSWVKELGRPEVVIEGIDLQIHDNPDRYRSVVTRIKSDPNCLGGLVTTHKIDLFEAAGDLFDSLEPDALLLGEVTSISKRKGRLEGHAVDIRSAGLSLDAIVGTSYFGRSGGQVLCFGAGGSATATLLTLIRKKNDADRPKKITLVDRLPERLSRIRTLLEKLPTTDIEIETVLNENRLTNDELLAHLPEGSLVINATGMGKDTPGSPVTESGKFPLNGIVWEFNYRGELDFYHQALAQRERRGLKVEDGWLYFLYGWSLVLSHVLHLEITPALFNALAEIAADQRSN